MNELNNGHIEIEKAAGLYELGRYEPALNQLLQVSGKPGVFYYARYCSIYVGALVHLGRQKEARSFLIDELEHNTEDDVLYFLLTKTYSFPADAKKILELLKVAIELNADEIDYHTNIVLVYIKLNKFKEA